MDFTECKKSGFKMVGNCKEVNKKQAECYFSNNSDDEVLVRIDKENLVEIRLKQGSPPEIEFALCLIEIFKWRSIFCKGSDPFLNNVADMVIPGQSNRIPSLSHGRLTFLFDKSDEPSGFTESGEWGPTPKWKNYPEPEEPEEEPDNELEI
jgi:hypothetical protein